MKQDFKKAQAISVAKGQASLIGDNQIGTYAQDINIQKAPKNLDLNMNTNTTNSIGFGNEERSGGFD